MDALSSSAAGALAAVAEKDELELVYGGWG